MAPRMGSGAARCRYSDTDTDVFVGSNEICVQFSLAQLKSRERASKRPCRTVCDVNAPFLVAPSADGPNFVVKNCHPGGTAAPRTRTVPGSQQNNYNKYASGLPNKQNTHARAHAKKRQRQLINALASATLGDLALGDAIPSAPARAVED
eukprot:5267754-Prymnesium_polylepis.1